MKKIVMLLAFFSAVLGAEDMKRLTFEQVYLKKGEVLLQPLPNIPGWNDDARYCEVREDKLFLVDARSGRARVLLDPKALKIQVPAGLDLLKPDDHTVDYALLAFIHEDDVYLFQRKTATLRRLTATAVAEKNPDLSPAGRWLAFTSCPDLFVADTATGTVSQLTFDGSELILNGYASWIYYEEILGRAGKHKAFDWSPDSRKIGFMRFDQSRVPQFPLFDATGPYGRLEMQRYPKPGFPNPEVKIGVIDLAGRQTEWIVLPPEVDHYLTFLAWAPDNKSFYMNWLNRGQEDWRIFEYRFAGKELRQVFRELLLTWAEPVASGDFHVLADGRMLLLSQRSGWSHICLREADGVERMLTQGEWSVKGIEFVDEKNGQVFFSADKENSVRSDLYRVSLQGGEAQRLTGAGGSHALTFSPGGSFYLDRHSSIGRPAALQLCASDGRIIRPLGDSAAPAFSRLALGKVELFRIPAADGFQLPAAWYLPPGFDPRVRYPVVLSVYGGPDSRSVLDAFPRRLDDYFLAQQGIIVLKVDHRGSGHFGRKGMDAMHRCLGKWELADYGSAVAYLRTLPFVDGEKIGITGGSYGGYVAALAVVSAPDLFSCAIAEFAVSDWALYDSVYTERYMDTPDENPEGYRQASVLSHLQTYRGGLRLIHGSMDDNVHMQNALQLIDGILQSGKTAEFMIYPGERHGIRGPKAAENAASSLAFWRKMFFAGKAEKTDRDPGPGRQEKKP
ncbi:MAG TPA: DPP IV N-terminal domain-containing protein [Candidatus Binatia bacterium]|nr:DPP IV N-terminal domain-containing protein [Candidatus Binatia bacterium]